MPEPEDFTAKKLADEIDAEVKRVSQLFRFILKFRQHFRPSGIEFSDLRQYLPSDDAGRIDWKSSARLNDLYVKEFDEEKDMDTFILLDCSDTMLFGTADKLKSEYAAVLASTMAYASVDAGINAGFGMYGGGQQVFMSPDGRQKQYHAILQEVTKSEYYGGKFNLEEALGDIIGQLRENTAIFVISDFIDIEGEWQPEVKFVNSKFRHLMSVMVRDRRDYKMPEAGNFRLEAPGGDGTMIVNTSSVKQRFDEEAQRQEEEIKDKLRSKGSGFLKLDTRDSFAAEFASYFDQQGVNW